MGKRYKIGYLPNTSRAIYGELLDNKQMSKVTKLKFPLKSILMYITILGSFLLMIVLAVYLRFKFLVITSMIFYPINIALYLKEGLKLGLWFSFNNEGLLFLTLGLGIISMLLLVYFIESRREPETPTTLIMAQLVSAIQIIALFAVFK